jgi:hypothetical protein
MPNITLYQMHVNAIYATLRAWEKDASLPNSRAHHKALADGFAALNADFPSLVVPADGDPKP